MGRTTVPPEAGNTPGCRTCNRRRIRCDGTIPACRKCLSRGLSCPGYHKPLKWICGAASKGPNRRDFTDSSSSNRAAILDTLPSALSPHGSQFMLPQPDQALLKHFVDVVTLQLAWYEDGSNPWRCLILPLAFQSQSLLSSILSLAACNITSRLCNENPQKTLYLSAMSSHRDKAFSFLAQDLELLRFSMDSPSEHLHLVFNAVIASIILLSYLELHWPEDGQWRTHLQSAQKISELELSSRPDSTSKFLLEELFAASTWPLLTTHPSRSMPGGHCRSMSVLNISLENLGSQTSVFTGFLWIMRQVTDIERDLVLKDGDDEGGRSSRKTTLDRIQSALTRVHDCAINTIESQATFQDGSRRNPILKIIRAYFYATKIYSFQALDHGCLHDDLSEDRALLIESLSTLEDPDFCAQDQPWPLFIVGTLSIGDLDTQHWVESRMKSVMDLFCAMDRPRILHFLRCFWSQRPQMNWIHYARGWTKEECEFLIL